jgi:hypothetical protein
MHVRGLGLHWKDSGIMACSDPREIINGITNFEYAHSELA